jgi:hypothetical protein
MPPYYFRILGWLRERCMMAGRVERRTNSREQQPSSLSSEMRKGADRSGTEQLELKTRMVWELFRAGSVRSSGDYFHVHVVPQDESQIDSLTQGTLELNGERVGKNE